MALDLATLKNDITEYLAEHAKATESKNSSAERMKTVRLALETNEEHLASAQKVIDEFRTRIQEIADENSGMLPALYSLLKTSLLTTAKEERDNFILGFDGKNLVQKTESFDRAKLEELETRINLLYSTLVQFGVDVSEIPTTKSEKTGKVSIIPRLPRAENKSVTDAIVRKIIWTVDGKEFKGYSIAAMRKVLCADRELRPTIADLRALLDNASDNGESKTFVFRSQVVTYRTENLTDAEQEEIDSLDDEAETLDQVFED